MRDNLLSLNNSAACELEDDFPLLMALEETVLGVDPDGLGVSFPVIADCLRSNFAPTYVGHVVKIILTSRSGGCALSAGERMLSR